MYKKVIVFVVFFALALGEGYLFFGAGVKSKSNAEIASQKAAQPVQAQPAAGSSGGSTAGDTASSAEAAADPAGQIFFKRGCVSCHTISALNVKGGQVGPDLSTIYDNVEAKHGMKLEDFLKKPNSAVMSGVIGGKPLTDDELKAVVTALKTASEKAKAK